MVIGIRLVCGLSDTLVMLPFQAKPSAVASVLVRVSGFPLKLKAPAVGSNRRLAKIVPEAKSFVDKSWLPVENTSKSFGDGAAPPQLAPTCQLPSGAPPPVQVSVAPRIWVTNERNRPAKNAAAIG